MKHVDRSFSFVYGFHVTFCLITSTAEILEKVIISVILFLISESKLNRENQ